jgi:hypothetical protein
MNLALWMLDATLCGILIGRELHRWWQILLACAGLGAIGWWLGGLHALGPPNTSELLVIIGAMIAGHSWLLIANNRTYRDKLAMTSFLRDNLDLQGWWALSEATDTISYRQHLYEHFMLQKPMRHYPPILQAAVKRAPSAWRLHMRARQMKREMENHDV